MRWRVAVIFPNRSAIVLLLTMEAQGERYSANCRHRWERRSRYALDEPENLPAEKRFEWEFDPTFQGIWGA
jgi:hypothetical protein